MLRGSPRPWLSSFRNEGCVCAKPQARWVLLTATAPPLHGAKSTRLEIKALKLYLRARIHTLKSLTEPPGLPESLSTIQPYRALTSLAAAVWPKRGRIRSRDTREQPSSASVPPLCQRLAGLADTSPFPQTCRWHSSAAEIPTPGHKGGQISGVAAIRARSSRRSGYCSGPMASGSRTA